MVRRLLVAVCAVLALGAGTGAPSAAGLADTGAGGTADAAGPSGRAAGGPAPDGGGPQGRAVSDLHVGRSDPEAVHPGGSTTVHAFVTNGGPDRTAAGFTVLVVLPAGTRAEGPFFPETCQVSEDGRRVRCSFPPGLSSLRSATALVPLRVGADTPAPSTLTGGRVVVVGPDDPDTSDNRQPFEVAVVPE
ncbi:hypothetical protein GCM10018781_12190 [Kitasatospora indigofera]|uniref:DUF11 domain-containing protein n=1 Tax=Kitasatospora indigofera TaxID=67307 RepID=A0A919FFP8_9ACTN|nr:hypothetical protein [Kitasatospora indigofera]GHH63176.1 hypothetical protein GCM10018781_12190 [Kitasatospora indigofera]